MSIPVTRTKYILPRRRSDLLFRQRLIDLMAGLLDHKLVILAAPAGYGKTSLLIDTAYHTSFPVCWYAIDPLDRDFKRFAAYFIASINHKFPSFGQQASIALDHLSQIDPDIDQFVTILANDLYDNIQEHFLLILDDYHYVDEQLEINRFLGGIIQAVDENCHLVISSRTLLSLPDIPLMVARSQVGGLSLDELAFKPAEIRALIDQNYHQLISEQLADELARETEGWITGLLLSTQSQWQGTPERVRTARVSAVGLYDYLAQQVLDQQSEMVKDFLLKTSFLEEFDAELCEDVFGPVNYPGIRAWSDLLELTLHNNLFVLPVGEKGNWLRYHHLFRDFLQSKLSSENPEEEKRIVRRLAQVYSKRDEWDKAYNLYKKLGDDKGIVDLIERAGIPFLRLGRSKTLASWIDSLPPWDLSDNPILLSLRGSVAVMIGEVDRGLTFLNHSVAGLRKAGNITELARTLPRRAHALQYLGRYQEALDDANEAIELCDDLPSLRMMKAMALRSRGLNLYRLGQRDEAIQCLKDSAGIYDVLGSVEETALVNIDLGMIYQVAGDYSLSKYAYENARNSFVKIGDLARLATVQNNLGVLYHVQGKYEQASLLFEQALSTSKQSGFLRMEALTLVSVGDLYRELDAPDAADKAYQQAREIAERIEDRYLLFYLYLVTASLNIQKKDLQGCEENLIEATRIANESRSSFDLGMVYLERARSFLLSDEILKAIPLLLDAARVFESGKNKIETARAYVYLAASYERMQKREDAMVYLRQSIDIAEGMENQHFLFVSARDIRQTLKMWAALPSSGPQIRNLVDQVDRIEGEIRVARRHLRRKTSTVPFAPPRLIIRSFGGAEVLIDGKHVTEFGLNSQDSRDLFFLLISNSEGMTRESIGAKLWPNSSPEQLKYQFKNAIYRLRRSLQQDVIQLVDDRYQFNRSLDYEYDLEIFTNKLAQVQDTSSSREKVSLLKEIYCIFKGEFLPGQNAAWVLPIRTDTHQKYINASMMLGELYYVEGEFEKSLSIAQDLLHIDSCMEAAHRLALRALAAQGNFAGVLRQYNQCVHSLDVEFHIQPSHQTVELFQNLLSINPSSH